MTMRKGLRVLVVDDASDNAEMLAELVSTFGHTVRVAHEGAAALALLDQEAADLVFLDIGLPDASGFEIAASIRSRHGRSCRIVALTGYSDAEAKDAARNAGFDAFLVKPFDFARIEALLSADDSQPEARPT